MKRKVFIIALVAFLVGAFVGAAWYRLRLWPADELQSLRQEMEGVPQDFKLHEVVAYEAGVPFYTDRNYYDEIGAPELKNTWCVQIPRHTHDDIVIEAEVQISVYRLLADANDNTPFAAWQMTGIKPKVRGRSSVFDKVVAKKFEPGTIALNPGGPKAACPILVRVHGKPSEGLGFRVTNH